MSRLVYCILPRPATDLGAHGTGVDGQPVCLVSHRDLSAATSLLSRKNMQPDISRLRAYERVVALFHSRSAVIPMRYGCAADDESQVVRMVMEHAEEHGLLLKELEGCTEIGLRILPAGQPLPAMPPPSPAGDGACPRTGLDYLRARIIMAGRSVGGRSAAKRPSAAARPWPDGSSNASANRPLPAPRCCPCIFWCGAGKSNRFGERSTNTARRSRPSCY
ncbi:MAG: GvpL/GvpF family gas vesicle protein [Desulfovibrionaceae bacterium]|nr:GvpL/GvpF family gas vesicle protein [Desulfovibrionaceae bacterium]